jgi:oligoendopeptidase F
MHEEMVMVAGDSLDRSLKDEYESLVNEAKQLGFELEASRLTNSYNSIRYHSSNPDQETRKQTIEKFNKIANELRQKIRETG